MRANWLWCLTLLLLTGCSMAPAPPDPAATEEAVRIAVAATASAVAVPGGEAAAPAGATAAPTLPPVGATAAPKPAAATAPPKPAATTAAVATGAPGGATPPAGTPGAAGAATGVVTAGTPGTAVAGTPGLRLTAEEAAYIRGVGAVMREYNRSFDRFRELVQAANATDPSWRLQLEAELTLWASGAEAAREVRPPDSMQGVHQRLVGGLELYQLAAGRIVQAVREGNDDGVRRGLETALQARAAFVDAERELQRIARERSA